ncbi:phosphoribosylglycinamide formyltransferase [candidate division KSB1 bacterium]|nr:phosphoribosylglycinamide formyltransferase [candidate division KSB1 bacterium]
MALLRLAVLASGKGSNFEAILQSINSGKLKATIQVVISNKASAGALEIARNYNIPAVHISAKEFPEQEQFDEKLLAVVCEYQANFIVLAGYLKMLSPEIIRAFKNRILNIHPALLPSFGGKGMYGHHVHQAVLDYGCKVTGVTVHLVDEQYDTGVPVLQRCVPVLDDDDAESLAARVLKVEHQIFTEALQLFADDRIEIIGRSVKIKPEAHSFENRRSAIFLEH